MSRQHENNYESTLASPIDAVQTTITVSSAVNLPTISPGDLITLTIDTGSIREIVYVTAVSGTTLTVIRGQENTSPSAFISGTKIEHRLTAETIDDKLSKTDDFIDDDTMLSATSMTVSSSESIKSYIDSFSQQRAKAWGTYDQSAGLTVSDSFNVASISDDGVGLATVTLSTPMLNSNYVVVAMHESAETDKVGSSGYVPGGSVTASSFQIETAKDNGDAIDSNRVSFVVFGDQ